MPVDQAPWPDLLGTSFSFAGGFNFHHLTCLLPSHLISPRQFRPVPPRKVSRWVRRSTLRIMVDPHQGQSRIKQTRRETSSSFTGRSGISVERWKLNSLNLRNRHALNPPRSYMMVNILIYVIYIYDRFVPFPFLFSRQNKTIQY